MDITKLIPSKDVREHNIKIGHEFTEWEKAAIIYNLTIDMDEKYRLLNRLAEKTSDGILKRQILERIDYDEKGLELFENDADGCFYEVTFLGDSWYKTGHFASVQLAKSFGQSEGVDFCIKKHQIIGIKTPQVKTYTISNWRFWNAHGMMTEKDNRQAAREQDYSGEPIAEARYNARGKMKEFDSYEFPIEEIMRMNDFGAERFEDKYVYIPHPFQAGDIVCCVGEPDTKGVVETTQTEHNDFRQRVSKEKLIVDWTDSSIQILFRGKYDGILSHDHIIPLYLEYAVTKDMDMKRDALAAAGKVIRGELSLGVFMDIYRSDIP